MTDRPELTRGERVTVYEDGIAPWLGIVNSVKYSKASGWWIEVDREGQGIWSICLKTTRVEAA
jgi:hypothetical protein